MYHFKGVLENVMYAEDGVNIAIKGLEEVKLMLAPTGPGHELDKEQTGKDLTFTLIPSSGTTEGRVVGIEIENGTEKTTDNTSHWEITLTASSESKPTDFKLAIVCAEDLEELEEEGEEEEAKKE